MSFCTRFAPSPTGRLHLGHAFSALSAWDWAQAHGGRLLLRLEDIDAARCRPEFEAGVLEDLRWLGVVWEEPVLRQSQRLALYRAALERLIAEGLVYRCFRTRKEVLAEIASAPHGPAGAPFRGGPLPPEQERERLARGEEHAWRLDLAACRRRLGARWEQLGFWELGRGPQGEHGRIKAEPERLGDVVLARKDYGVSYHLAACLDDAATGVSHVVRGEDLHEAAHLHRLLQALLEWPEPVYCCHPLVLGPSGQRLAKRDQAASLAALRAAGETPDGVRALLAPYFTAAGSADAAWASA
jgi:glutamyl-Q tRNA(Asp) synthetase